MDRSLRQSQTSSIWVQLWLNFIPCPSWPQLSLDLRRKWRGLMILVSGVLNVRTMWCHSSTVLLAEFWPLCSLFSCLPFCGGEAGNVACDSIDDYLEQKSFSLHFFFQFFSLIFIFWFDTLSLKLSGQPTLSQHRTMLIRLPKPGAQTFCGVHWSS